MISLLCLSLLIIACLVKPPFSLALSGHLEHVAKNYPEWKPDAIVDVGANVGKWSTAARRSFPDAKLMMFEAFSAHDATLKGVAERIGNADHTIAVLTAADGEKVSFYERSATSSGNSIFQEQTHHFDGVKPVDRTTSTLDTEIGRSFLAGAHVDYLKIDVQGAELAVLQGATRLLSGVTFVQLEVSLIEYNKGGACLFELDTFLRSQGFFLYELKELHVNSSFKTKGTGQMDVLYVRPTSDRIPDYFKNEKPQYCGADRPSDLISDLIVGHGVPQQKTGSTIFCIGAVLGILVGFVFGRMTGRKRVEKSV